MSARHASESLSESAVLELWTEIYPQLREARRGNPLYRIQHVPLSPMGCSLEDLRSHLIKDTYMRYLFLRGYDVISVPSWDRYASEIEMPLHGLMDTTAVREQCETIVRDQIQQQEALLRSFGILADWKGANKPILPRQDAKLLNLLRQFQETGYLARRRQPGYWCIQCQATVSADELVYHERERQEATILFPVRAGLEDYGDALYMAGWLADLACYPGISALAVQSDERYLLIAGRDRRVLCPQPLLPQMQARGYEEILAEFPAAALATCNCTLPFQNMEIPVVLVTERQPASIRALAPGHDFQDYLLAQQYQIEVRSVIDAEGHFSDEADHFCGIPALKASPLIQFTLEQHGYLFDHALVSMSTPHCWKCGAPLIFRSEMQWILQPEAGSLPKRLSNVLDSIEWDDPRTAERIGSLFHCSNDWSIARKRAWGVPFPVLYCTHCGEPLSVSRIGKSIRDFITRKGLQAWFTQDVHHIVPADTTCTHCGREEFSKEDAVLRSAFTSAIYDLFHQSSGPRRDEVQGLFLESLRLHGSWFAIWLFTTVAYENQLPVRQLRVHDLSCDPECVHIEENPTIQQLTQYPRDQVRLWMLCHEPWDRVREMFEEIARIGERLGRVPQDSLALDDISHPPHDPLLIRVGQVQARVAEDYHRLAFREGIAKVLDCWRQDIQPILDRGDEVDPPAPLVLGHVLRRFLIMLAPVVPVMAEQLWRSLGNERSIFFEVCCDMPTEATDAGQSDEGTSSENGQRMEELREALETYLRTTQGKGKLKLFLGDPTMIPMVQACLSSLLSKYDFGSFEIVDFIDDVPQPEPLEAIPHSFIGWEGERIS